jgi:hypothetical protein
LPLLLNNPIKSKKNAKSKNELRCEEEICIHRIRQGEETPRLPQSHPDKENKEAET